MQTYSASKMFSTIAAVILLLTPLLANFLSQDPVPSPTASTSPEVSPSVSPSPTPTRTPSPTPLPGAQNFHQWGSITVFNGLPSDSVRAIAQTPDGVMWFGTDNGLARFDGRRIQNFLPGGSDSNRILSLQAAPNGELWVGTQSGAFVYLSNQFQRVEGVPDAGITAILVASEESYLGTDSGLVLRLLKRADGTIAAEPVLRQPMSNKDGAPVTITKLLKVDNQLLTATSGSGVFAIVDGHADEFVTSPSVLAVNSILRGDTGQLWFASNAARGASGVYELSRDSRAVRVAASTGNVVALESNDGGVWAGTERFGLFHFSRSKLTKNYTFENTSGGLRSNNIFALFTDREGVIWIGTNRGVSRFDRMGALQETVSDIPNSNFIRTLYPAPVEGEIFYAGSNRGLFRNDDDGNWIEVPGLRNRSVYAISTRGSSLLVGTPDGLFDMAGRKILSGDVRSFAEFNARHYAAVFGRGVFDITTDSPQLVYANESVTSLAAHPKRLLIGTNGEGLYSFDGKNPRLEIAAETLKSGAIWKLDVRYDTDSIWIAGQHGVFVIRNGSSEQIIAVEDVRDIWVNSEEVWAATTTRGLVYSRRDVRFGWLTTAIGFEQGLPSEKAFSILPIEGGFLIGTNRGVVTYRPGEVEPKLLPVRVLGQRVYDLTELTSKIDLEYPQNSLLVEVTGLSSRTFPEEFQYAFVLTNNNGDEVDRRISNDSQYAPTGLRAGDYRIDAIAFNRDLLASEPLTISFSIAQAPFPWTATALGVLLVLSLVGLVWAVVEHRRIAHRNRELAAARLDLANEAERERRRIARDLHDQTLADLRKLMITSDKLIADNGAFRGEIEAVSTEIRRICEDLSPSVLENVGLVAALEFLLDRTVENRRFRADDGVEDRIGFPLNVQLQIYRIAQEVLTNIDRHSDAELVEMDVAASPAGEFLLTIRDDGEVFQADNSAKKGRGISNIRARANLINGKAVWKGSRDGGNVFSLKIGGNES